MPENKGIIFVESNKLSFYAPEMEHPISLAFPTAGVAYMEVLDKDLVYNQIQSFVVSNKLTPRLCTIILGTDITFQKVIRQTQKEQKDEMIASFLNNVPFDSVSKITYDTTDTTYIFATNEELYTTVRRGFEKLGYGIDAVIPVALFANANITPGVPLTAQSAAYLAQSVEAVKQFNFINVERETAIRSAKKGKKPVSAKDRKREKVLGGVFGGLLVVLLVVFLTSNMSTTPQNTRAAPKAPPPSAPVVAPGNPQVSPAPRTDGKDLISVTIINTQASEDSAGIVKSALAQAGFTSIESESTTSAVSSVSFSESVPDTRKNEILTILRPLLPDFTVLSHAGGGTGVVLTVGQ